MPWLPAAGARELLRGSAGQGRAALPRESLRQLWKRQSSRFSPRPPSVSPPTLPGFGPLLGARSLQGFGQPPLPAGGSAFPAESSRTSPAAFRRETLSFSLVLFFSSQAGLRSSFSGRSLSRPPGRTSQLLPRVRWPFICLFIFSPGF